jgi:tRNA (guanine37-N1)-methyltransferase
MITFDILTTFPNSFSYLNESIIKRAQFKGLVKINIHDLRNWATDKHKTTDDRPFGGNPGMLMKIEPIYRAMKDLGLYPDRDSKTKVILTSAKGETWNQPLAQKFSEELERLVIICGHYEGVDHRVEEFLVDHQISIGPYVLSGGELPAMIILDSITRLVSGVLGNDQSLSEETNTLSNPEYPQYTRPALFKTDEGEGWGVPDILLSGHHKKIEEWKKGV